ncbi:melanization protease 1 [Contarinia nasturtii]|uniref:melanization protease 1 n=1 Tax=Contarinia nasturtii TaxID=265458 RepID=UPI0012D3F4F4|nr:melanization protease 1 [Contarinia nasturtii]
MCSLNVGQIVWICVIGAMTVWPVYSWNPDYFFYDDAPMLPHYVDRDEPMGLNQYKMPTYQWPQCNCIKLKECTIFTLKLRSAPKPLSSTLMKDIRKKACGFAGVDPLVCCPSSDVLPHGRTFREVHTTEKPWIWDSQTKPIKKQPTNLFNRLNPDDDNWGQSKQQQPNNVHSPKKPITDKNFYTRKTKKYHFFNFEDPRTYRNCPPSFSPDFHIPPYFQHVKPLKNFHHISNEANGFDFNHVDNEPNFIFPHALPNSVNDVPTFPSRVAKHSIEKLSLINADNCGISIQQRIIGGDDAVPGQFPWMARLAYRNRTSQLVSYRCSGSVISKKYILTAAHCVSNLVDDLELIYVRLGELDSRSNLCDNNRNLCNEPQDYEIESIEHHPSYDMPKYANDIALIRLRHITNSSFVSPLCLPLGPYEATDKNLDQKMAIVAGWGVSTPLLGGAVNPMLQYIRLPIVNTQSCANSYASYSANSRIPIIISESQLCAQGTTNHDACQGDSGGPLMREDSQTGRYILLGLVSFGPRTCGVAAFPGVYSRTSAHLDWILNTIQL